MESFAEEMKRKGVERITTDKKFVKSRKSNICKESILHKRYSAVKSDDISKIKNVGPDEVLCFCSDNLTSAEKSELRNKKFCKQSIDLHGKTEQQAIDFMEANLQKCHNKNFRFLEIIHGRGNKTNDDYPTLKNAVNQKLRNCRYVKGFCSVLLDNGNRNTGAVMVMLEQNNHR